MISFFHHPIEVIGGDCTASDPHHRHSRFEPGDALASLPVANGGRRSPDQIGNNHLGQIVFGSVFKQCHAAQYKRFVGGRNPRSCGLHERA